MRLSLPLLLAAVLASGCASGGAPRTAAPQCPCFRDTHEQLQGTLWMQTAAEYQVLARTTYREAGEAIGAALADKTWTAATEQTSDPSALPPAVILDLDETVLDNSRFQGEQVVRRASYSPGFWSDWTTLKKAGDIPGAKDFLEGVRKQGIAVFFVTNRTLGEEPATLENLKTLGIEATADEILAKEENGWTSDKTARRQFLAQSYRILLLIGDDLGDFIPSKLTPEKRVEEAAKHGDWWGTRWFLLPNPMYGSWDGALTDHKNPPDAETLQRKRALVKGFEN